MLNPIFKLMNNFMFSDFNLLPSGYILVFDTPLLIVEDNIVVFEDIIAEPRKKATVLEYMRQSIIGWTNKVNIVLDHSIIHRPMLQYMMYMIYFYFLPLPFFVCSCFFFLCFYLHTVLYDVFLSL